MININNTTVAVETSAYQNNPLYAWYKSDENNISLTASY